jgi:uncharacterized Zn finger protein (UPF0148 family)
MSKKCECGTKLVEISKGHYKCPYCGTRVEDSIKRFNLVKKGEKEASK